MKQDLTQGPIARTLLGFALPMTAGNLLQQFYNITDTLVIGKFVGANALAAVGASYTLMTFLTSILLGLSMGSGVAVSIAYGKRDMERLQRAVFFSFAMIAAATVLLSAIAFGGIDGIMWLLQVPEEIEGMMRSYLLIIFTGIGGTFLYNYYACLLRAVGNSVAPLFFLGVSAVINIVLDLVFVLVFHWDVEGAAFATILAQWVSGIGLFLYTRKKNPELRLRKSAMVWNREEAAGIFRLSSITCVQQSIMNFGILMVQGRVNSFGPAVMAAFAAAVKIDSFAYMPVQDFGNAFSTFIAQNYGAGKKERIRQGIRSAVLTSMLFGGAVSLLVWIFARSLLLIFVQAKETEILDLGIQYLRTEGAFYCMIGLLFLFYGFFRAVEKPGVSVFLTVVSLGLRVVLAYGLSAIPALGATGIWISIPIGWLIADVAGGILMWQFFKSKEAGREK